MNTFIKAKLKLSIRFITTVIIIAFLCQNAAWANGLSKQTLHQDTAKIISKIFNGTDPLTVEQAYRMFKGTPQSDQFLQSLQKAIKEINDGTWDSEYSQKSLIAAKTLLQKIMQRQNIPDSEGRNEKESKISETTNRNKTLHKIVEFGIKIRKLFNKLSLYKKISFIGKNAFLVFKATGIVIIVFDASIGGSLLCGITLVVLFNVFYRKLPNKTKLKLDKVYSIIKYIVRIYLTLFTFSLINFLTGIDFLQVIIVYILAKILHWKKGWVWDNLRNMTIGSIKSFFRIIMDYRDFLKKGFKDKIEAEEKPESDALDVLRGRVKRITENRLDEPSLIEKTTSLGVVESGNAKGVLFDNRTGALFMGQRGLLSPILGIQKKHVKSDLELFKGAKAIQLSENNRNVEITSVSRDANHLDSALFFKAENNNVFSETFTDRLMDFVFIKDAQRGLEADNINYELEIIKVASVIAYLRDKTDGAKKQKIKELLEKIKHLQVYKETLQIAYFVTEINSNAFSYDNDSYLTGDNGTISIKSLQGLKVSQTRETSRIQFDFVIKDYSGDTSQELEVNLDNFSRIAFPKRGSKYSGTSPIKELPGHELEMEKVQFQMQILARNVENSGSIEERAQLTGKMHDLEDTALSLQLKRMILFDMADTLGISGSSEIFDIWSEGYYVKVTYKDNTSDVFAIWDLSSHLLEVLENSSGFEEELIEGFLRDVLHFRLGGYINAVRERYNIFRRSEYMKNILPTLDMGILYTNISEIKKTHDAVIIKLRGIIKEKLNGEDINDFLQRKEGLKAKEEELKKEIEQKQELYNKLQPAYEVVFKGEGARGDEGDREKIIRLVSDMSKKLNALKEEHRKVKEQRERLERKYEDVKGEIEQIKELELHSEDIGEIMKLEELGRKINKTLMGREMDEVMEGILGGCTDLCKLGQDLFVLFEDKDKAQKKSEDKEALNEIEEKIESNKAKQLVLIEKKQKEYKTYLSELNEELNALNEAYEEIEDLQYQLSNLNKRLGVLEEIPDKKRKKGEVREIDRIKTQIKEIKGRISEITSDISSDDFFKEIEEREKVLKKHVMVLNKMIENMEYYRESLTTSGQMEAVMGWLRENKILPHGMLIVAYIMSFSAGGAISEINNIATADQDFETIGEKATKVVHTATRAAADISEDSNWFAKGILLSAQVFLSRLLVSLAREDSVGLMNRIMPYVMMLVEYHDTFAPAAFYVENYEEFMRLNKEFTVGAELEKPGGHYKAMTSSGFGENNVLIKENLSFPNVPLGEKTGETNTITTKFVGNRISLFRDIHSTVDHSSIICDYPFRLETNSYRDVTLILETGVFDFMKLKTVVYKIDYREANANFVPGEEFVEHYTELPDNEIPPPTLKKRLDPLESLGFEQKIAGVSTIMADGFEYGMGADAVMKFGVPPKEWLPYGFSEETFADGKKLQADCDVFAMYAMLLFRYLGVPARFIAGATDNDNDGKITMTHGYIEIMDPENGGDWQIFDPTAIVDMNEEWQGSVEMPELEESDIEVEEEIEGIPGIDFDPPSSFPEEETVLYKVKNMSIRDGLTYLLEEISEYEPEEKTIDYRVLADLRETGRYLQEREDFSDFEEYNSQLVNEVYFRLATMYTQKLVSEKIVIAEKEEVYKMLLPERLEWKKRLEEQIAEMNQKYAGIFKFDYYMDVYGQYSSEEVFLKDYYSLEEVDEMLMLMQEKYPLHILELGTEVNGQRRTVTVGPGPGGMGGYAEVDNSAREGRRIKSPINWFVRSDGMYFYDLAGGSLKWELWYKAMEEGERGYIDEVGGYIDELERLTLLGNPNGRDFINVLRENALELFRRDYFEYLRTDGMQVTSGHNETERREFLEYYVFNDYATLGQSLQNRMIQTHELLEKTVEMNREHAPLTFYPADFDQGTECMLEYGFIQQSDTGYLPLDDISEFLYLMKYRYPDHYNTMFEGILSQQISSLLWLERYKYIHLFYKDIPVFFDSIFHSFGIISPRPRLYGGKDVHLTDLHYEWMSIISSYDVKRLHKMNKKRKGPTDEFEEIRTEAGSKFLFDYLNFLKTDTVTDRDNATGEARQKFFEEKVFTEGLRDLPQEEEIDSNNQTTVIIDTDEDLPEGPRPLWESDSPMALGMDIESRINRIIVVYEFSFLNLERDRKAKYYTPEEAEELLRLIGSRFPRHLDVYEQETAPGGNILEIFIKNRMPAFKLYKENFDVADRESHPALSSSLDKWSFIEKMVLRKMGMPQDRYSDTLIGAVEDQVRVDLEIEVMQEFGIDYKYYLENDGNVRSRLHPDWQEFFDTYIFPGGLRPADDTDGRGDKDPEAKRDMSPSERHKDYEMKAEELARVDQEMLDRYLYELADLYMPFLDDKYMRKHFFMQVRPLILNPEDMLNKTGYSQSKFVRMLLNNMRDKEKEVREEVGRFLLDTFNEWKELNMEELRRHNKKYGINEFQMVCEYYGIEFSGFPETRSGMRRIIAEDISIYDYGFEWVKQDYDVAADIAMIFNLKWEEDVQDKLVLETADRFLETMQEEFDLIDFEGYVRVGRNNREQLLYIEQVYTQGVLASDKSDEIHSLYDKYRERYAKNLGMVDQGEGQDFFAALPKYDPQYFSLGAQNLINLLSGMSPKDREPLVSELLTEAFAAAEVGFFNESERVFYTTIMAGLLSFISDLDDIYQMEEYIKINFSELSRRDSYVILGYVSKYGSREFKEFLFDGLIDDFSGRSFIIGGVDFADYKVYDPELDGRYFSVEVKRATDALYELGVRRDKVMLTEEDVIPDYYTFNEPYSITITIGSYDYSIQINSGKPTIQRMEENSNTPVGTKYYLPVDDLEYELEGTLGQTETSYALSAYVLSHWEDMVEFRVDILKKILPYAVNFIPEKWNKEDPQYSHFRRHLGSYGVSEGEMAISLLNLVEFCRKNDITADGIAERIDLESVNSIPLTQKEARNTDGKGLPSKRPGEVIFDELVRKIQVTNLFASILERPFDADEVPLRPDVMEEVKSALDEAEQRGVLMHFFAGEAISAVVNLPDNLSREELTTNVNLILRNPALNPNGLLPYEFLRVLDTYSAIATEGEQIRIQEIRDQYLLQSFLIYLPEPEREFFNGLIQGGKIEVSDGFWYYEDGIGATIDRMYLLDMVAARDLGAKDKELKRSANKINRDVLDNILISKGKIKQVEGRRRVGISEKEHTSVDGAITQDRDSVGAISELSGLLEQDTNIISGILQDTDRSGYFTQINFLRGLLGADNTLSEDEIGLIISTSQEIEDVKGNLMNLPTVDEDNISRIQGSLLVRILIKKLKEKAKSERDEDRTEMSVIIRERELLQFTVQVFQAL